MTFMAKSPYLYRIPYMNAVSLEASQIGIVVPVATPRMAEKDINYGDFVIPKVPYLHQYCLE